MATVTSKSRPGSIVAEAYRLQALAERAAKKAPKDDAPDVHTKSPKVMHKGADVHKKAGKVNKPAVKKKARAKK